MAAKRSTSRKSVSRKSAPGRPRKRAAATRRGGRPAAAAQAPRTPAAGSVDLAGGMRAMLESIEAEVRAVSSLSERIDQLVTDLNNQRAEQAKRLLVLDALRSSVSDAGLTAFLDKAIRPRRARVPEVVPKRLNQ